MTTLSTHPTGKIPFRTFGDVRVVRVEGNQYDVEYPVTADLLDLRRALHYAASLSARAAHPDSVCESEELFGCARPATQVVTVLVDYDDSLPAVTGNGRLDSRRYCTRHALDVTEELAHGEPPNAELVAVIAIPGT
jgi:hypothetical protein